MEDQLRTARSGLFNEGQDLNILDDKERSQIIVVADSKIDTIEAVSNDDVTYGEPQDNPDEWQAYFPAHVASEVLRDAADHQPTFGLPEPQDGDDKPLAIPNIPTNTMTDFIVPTPRDNAPDNPPTDTEEQKQEETDLPWQESSQSRVQWQAE